MLAALTAAHQLELQRMRATGSPGRGRGIETGQVATMLGAGPHGPQNLPHRDRCRLEPRPGNRREDTRTCPARGYLDRQNVSYTWTNLEPMAKTRRGACSN